MYREVELLPQGRCSMGLLRPCGGGDTGPIPRTSLTASSLLCFLSLGK